MHVVTVAQFYPFPGQGGAARWVELRQEWQKAGVEVTVIAGNVDHQTGELRDDLEEGVIRIPMPTLDKRRPGQRILRDLSFAWRAVHAKGVKPDVIIASSPPLFAGWAGMRLARRYRVPLIFEARDLWPDAAIEFGALSGPPAKAALWLEKRIYRTAAAVVTVTPGFARRLREKGVEPWLIPNGLDTRIFHDQFDRHALRQQRGWDDLVVLYAGVHGPSQDLHQVLDAAEQLPDIRFVFVGAGSEKESLLARASTWPNVQFLDPVPRAEVAELVAAADICLAPLADLDMFNDTYPAKVFEILGSGRPLIVTAGGELAKLAQESGGGLAVAPRNATQLTGAVESLRDAGKRARMGEAGSRYVREHFDRADLAKDYLARVRQLLDRNGGTR